MFNSPGRRSQLDVFDFSPFILRLRLRNLLAFVDGIVLAAEVEPCRERSDKVRIVRELR